MGLLNPVTTVLPLRDSLQGRDRSGLFSAAATGPVRYDDNGLIIEPGTTNLVVNPVAGTNTTGWDAVSDVTLARETSLPGPLPGYLAGITTGFRVTADNPVSATNPIASCPLTLTAAAHAHGWWVWVPSAFSATGLQISDANFASATDRAAIAVDLSKRDQWQWVPNGRMNPVAGDLSGHIQLQVTAGTMGAGDQVWFVAQCEAEAYSTSLAVGSMGPGYSWAATPNASASVRAETGVTFPSANRIDPERGAVVARVRLHDGGSGQREVFRAVMFSGGTGSDLIELNRGTNQTSPRLQARSNGGSVANAAASGLLADGQRTAVWGMWTEDEIMAASGGDALVVAARNTPIGTFGVNDAQIGRSAPGSSLLNGSISDFLIYDDQLSDQRRAIVLDALANDADMDELWELFEEWEAQGIASDTLELQSGEGTAGVAAIAEPMDLLALQDGQGTAGVRGEGQAMESVELQAGVGTLPYGYPARVTWRSP